MFEAWSVAIRLRLLDGVTSGLTVLTHQLLKTHGNARQLRRELEGIKSTIFSGALTAGVGFGLLYALKPAYEEAKKFQVELAKFETFGLGDKLNKDAERFAKSINVAGSTYVDNMRRMAEAQGVFRESGLKGPAALVGAKIAAPFLAKIDFIASTLDGESGARLKSQELDLLRFAEQRSSVNGRIDPGKFTEVAEAGFKAIRSSGGNVNWSLLRQFMANAGVAGRNMSDTALFGEMEPFIGELKGQAGFGTYTAYNRFQGLLRFLPKNAIQEFLKLGLWDQSKVVFGKNNTIQEYKGNPLRHADEFASSQFDYYWKYIRPAYDKAGYNQAERDRANALMGGNTGGKLYSLFDRQGETARMSVQAQAQQAGSDKALDIAGKTAVGKSIDLHAKFKNLLETMGESVLPIVIKFMEALTPPLKAIADFGQRHPRIFGFIIDGIVTLGASLAIMGTVVGTFGIFRGFILLFTKLNFLKSLLNPFTQLILKAPGVTSGLTGLATALRGLSLIPLLGGAGLAVALGAVAFGLGLLFAKIMDGQGKNFIQKGVDAKDGRRYVVGPGGSVVYLDPEKPKTTPYVPKMATPQQTTVHTAVHLDGKKVAEVVSKHIAKGISGFNAGSGRPDPAAAIPAPGAAYAR